ncbi:MAG: serpin family protein [Chloroflexota bacterium]
MKSLNFTLALLIALSLVLSACGPSPSASLAQSSIRRETDPSVPANDAQTLVRGDNAFALDMYRSLRDGDEGNLIFSPFSISLALAMTYAGARGETESQMAQTLHFDLPQSQLHPAFNALDLALAKRGESADKDREPLQLRIANAVWAEQTFPFQQDFLDTLAFNYGAGIRQADFINNYEPVRKEINAWVEDQTEDKIKNLLPEGVLDSFTRMVLVNAIYFKADWLYKFEKESTSDQPFHLLDGSTVTVPLMSQETYAPYAKGDGWQAIDFPYAGETASMTIILPDEGRFESFESTFDLATLDSILSGLTPTSLIFALPKFSFTRDFGLADRLAAMGMPDAFDPNRADFSGMTGKPDLYISDVIHKAFVAVDEEGTEAAAATAVIMELASAPMFEVRMIVDRPFLFLIRDTVSGQILFMGRVVNLR